MAQICPRCGGLEVGCPVCDAPPKHERPFDRRDSRTISVAFSSIAEAAWEVQGIDISAWNGIMDFNITKTKCQFAIVRLGYGNGWKDSRCDEYRRGLIAADMPYGVYWYCRPGEDYNAHANEFAEIAAEFPFQMNYEEDYEQTSLDKAETLAWIINMDTKLKSLVSKATSPYSSYGFWSGKVAPNNYFTNEQWVANWTNGDSPWMPPNWTWRKGCKWQWEADGNGKAREYGMVADGDVDMDLDRWYGTVDEYNSRFGTHILPIGQVEPPQPPTDFMMEVIVDSLYVRSGPGTAYGIVGHLHRGEEVALKNIGGSSAWMQIKSGPYAGKWCAVQTSYRYMNPKQ